jgi:iron(III) transport system substrate-binding protein
VTTPDPALSGASLDLLIGLQNSMGDQAWQLFDDLKKNGMVVSGPNAQAVTPVMQGRKRRCSARWIMSPTAIFSRASR